MEDAKSRKGQILLFFLPVIALTILSRLYGLSKFGLWLDEVFSFRLAKQDWNSLFQQAISDGVHPPLFYILLKIWILIGGESLVWLKALPLLFAIAVLVPLYLLCRDLTITFAEFCLALIFVSLNSYLIFFAQELRMYSLLAFLSITSMYLFVRFLKDESGSKIPAIILFAVNVLLVYTHYFGWMTVVAEGVVVLLLRRSKIKGFLAQAFAVGVCFLPWCFLVVSAMAQKGGLAGNIGWISRPGSSTIPLFLSEMHGKVPIRLTTSIGLLIFLPPVLIWLWQVYKGKNQNEKLIFLLLGLVSTIPIVLAFSASQILTNSIWVDRYLIAAAIPYILLFAVGVSRLNNLWLRRGFMALMICWSLGAGVWNFLYQRPRVNWTGLVDQISRSEQKPEKLFVLEDWAAMPFEWSLGEERLDRPIVQKVNGVGDIGDGKFWFAYRISTWKDQELPGEKLLRMNCVIEKEHNDVSDIDNVKLLLVRCDR